MFDKAKLKLKNAYHTYVPTATLPGMEPSYECPLAPHSADLNASAARSSARFSYQTTSSSASGHSRPPSCALPTVPSRGFGGLVDMQPTEDLSTGLHNELHEGVGEPFTSYLRPSGEADLDKFDFRF